MPYILYFSHSGCDLWFRCYLWPPKITIGHPRPFSRYSGQVIQLPVNPSHTSNIQKSAKSTLYWKMLLRHLGLFNYGVDKSWWSTEISAGRFRIFTQVSELSKKFHSFYAQEVKKLWRGLKKLSILFEANNVKIENVKIKFP